MKLSAEVNIGIGLPTTVPGATGDLVLEWARRADAGPFSSVGVLERVVYDSYDPFAALAAAAAATSRVRLATMIAIGPLRSTALLAKQAASVHGLSGGRLTLGLAVGARTEDFDAAGVEHKGRGKRLGEQLAYIRGDVDGDQRRALARRDRDPRRRAQRPGLLADGALRGRLRAQRRASAGVRERGRARARRVERSRPSGEAEALGPGLLRVRRPRSRRATYLRDYYAFTGPFAEKIAAGNLTSARAVKDYVRGYEEAGCDELVLFPTVAEIDELERLQEALA